MFTDLAGYRVQRELEVVRVVHPHGMLEPHALTYSRAAKALARAFWQASSLRTASALRATSPEERSSFQTAGYYGLSLMIPNGIDTPPQGGFAERGERQPPLPSTRTLLSLGRIHPKKGLPVLLRAWSQLAPAFADWQLVIAGPDERGHERELKALSVQLGVEQRCTFAGPVYGADKASLLCQSDVFVLPSYSENFGMVVAEALAAGVPVVTTTGTPWARIEKMECGWWVPPEVEALTSALRVALALPASDLRAMGQRGRVWMLAEFSWSAIAAVADDAFRGLLTASVHSSRTCRGPQR
jgi:glycosyltransferase involved in cell wall biosynthesis